MTMSIDWSLRWIDRRVVDLVVYKTYADLRAEAAKTYINYLWWIIDPILTMLVFYLVFGLLFQRGGDGFVAFLLCGLVIWNWYQQSISHAGNAVIDNKGLMSQVDVPKLVFALVTMLTDLTKFLLVFLLLLVFLWLSGYPVSAAYLAIPLLLATQLLMIGALAFWHAGIVPYAPDVKFLVNNLLHLQMFMSGVFFSIQDIPPQYHQWFYINPMAGLIEDYRAVLLHATWPDWGRLSLIGLGSMLLMALAVAFIHWRDKDYPRTLA